MNTTEPIVDKHLLFNKQKIAITGSNGYIGQNLIAFLKTKGYETCSISRDLLYTPSKGLNKILAGSYAIINLAGATINQRWNKKNKETIYNSRIITTHHLVKTINALPAKQRPAHFLSVSAVGIYKNGLLHHEESQQIDQGFLGKVVSHWEEEMQQLNTNVMCTTFRLGLVLGKRAKVIQQLSPIFKLGLGGTLGNGKQAFPFIHIADVLEAFDWAISRKKTGVYNLCTDSGTTNKMFTQAFAKALKRPAVFQVPAFVMRLIFGEMAVIVLKSPIVSNVKIKKAGFQFKYKHIQEAIAQSTS